GLIDAPQEMEQESKAGRRAVVVGVIGDDRRCAMTGLDKPEGGLIQPERLGAQSEEARTGAGKGDQYQSGESVADDEGVRAGGGTRRGDEPPRNNGRSPYTEPGGLQYRRGEAGTGGEGRQAQERGDGGAQIGEGRTAPKVAPCTRARTRHQNRCVFARMVG